jgi:hypothetical protein
MAQTVTLILAELVGLKEYIVKHSELTRKRRNQAFQNVPGDGRNISEDVHDPVEIVDEVTLEFNNDPESVFLKAAHQMMSQQMLDPLLAQPLIIYSYRPGTRIVDEIAALRAVIISISTPAGDTNSHSAATTKIVVKPERMAIAA